MFLTLLSASCGRHEKKGEEFLQDCVLPEDQSKTLTGHWAAAPIPLAFHGTDFTTAEIKSITAAADSWNAFFAVSIGVNALDYGGLKVRSSDSEIPEKICETSIIDNTSNFTGAVVVYKRKEWAYTSEPNVIAKTSYCPNSKSGFFTMAFIELNYAQYFSRGKQQPDLETILLHEFGHLLGLDHSCEYQKKDGFPLCSGPSANPKYLEASMFPAFGFSTSGEGVQKRKLGENDQGRANCLYKQ